MSDNPRKDLEQLEMLLILDEDWFKRELDSAKRMIGMNPDQPVPVSKAPAPKAAPVRNYGGGYSQPQPRPQRRVPAPAPVEAPLPQGKGIRNLILLACLEILGILGLGAYWMLVLLR